MAIGILQLLYLLDYFLVGVFLLGRAFSMLVEALGRYTGYAAQSPYIRFLVVLLYKKDCFESFFLLTSDDFVPVSSKSVSR